eukprot:CAMPEP_0181305486 /NCGR_PEP_ID=MMETSP1101-20121128/9758_1 /TAXON_ID=46948 /ORGANISM="Rhodomonas abbreviata, Strain Caron Lab Isolate" /LENGTH=170 /DNA_ID=CAMNT_0023411411 /DNA_START=322 /DNA_END=831 /DNA_ORIENTATION=+
MQGHLFLTLNDVTATNPKGFSEPMLASLKYLQVCLSPLSLFTRCVFLPHIIAKELCVWVERKEGLGLNVSVYWPKQRLPKDDQAKKGAEAEKDADSSHMDFVMSMLGMVNPSSMVDTVGEQVRKKGGVTNLVKDSIEGTADKAENIVRLGWDTVAGKTEELQEGWREAGG